MARQARRKGVENKATHGMVNCVIREVGRSEHRVHWPDERRCA